MIFPEFLYFKRLERLKKDLSILRNKRRYFVGSDAN